MSFFLPLCKFPPSYFKRSRARNGRQRPSYLFWKSGAPAWNGLASETTLAVTGAVHEARRRAEAPRPRWESRSSVSSPKDSSPSREPSSGYTDSLDSELSAQGSAPHSPRTSAITLPWSSAHCRAADLAWTAQTERATSAAAPGSQPPPSGLPFLSPRPSGPPCPRSGLNKDFRARSLPQPSTGVSAKHHPGHGRPRRLRGLFPRTLGAEKRLVWQGSRRNERGPSLPPNRPPGGRGVVDGGREGTSALGAQASGTQVRALRFGWLNGALYREPRLLKTIGTSLFWSHLPGNSLESQVLPPSKKTLDLPAKGKTFSSLLAGWLCLCSRYLILVYARSSAAQTATKPPPSAPG